MATAVPPGRERVLAPAVNTVFGAAPVLFVAFFSAVSLHEFHAYLSHALDVGTMPQTFWNTVHGHPFRFLNMRARVGVEAFGTNTRLSFHVEPPIQATAVIYALHQHVATLLVMQTVGIASGAIPARLLARRRLCAGMPELAFPIAYLLFPALEAANFYEFHPVAFWGRYVPPGYLRGIVTQADVRTFWLHHPAWVWDNLTSEAKLSYLHRILFPTGYLALLSPITLLTIVPSLALILLSYEPHMYGGLAHYSAELVPVMMVAAILGVEWLSRAVAPRLRISGPPGRARPVSVRVARRWPPLRALPRYPGPRRCWIAGATM
jgi:uncharacterized membrane protein